MSKLNKLVEVVFSNVVGTYDEFLDIDQSLASPETPDISKFKYMYSSLLKKHEPVVEELAKIEEVISQLRCRENIIRELRLYVSQEKYIYARTTFYQSDKRVNDIRTILGAVEELGSDLNTLYLDDDFIRHTVKKIQKGMDMIIKKNILSLRDAPKQLKSIEFNA